MKGWYDRSKIRMIRYALGNETDEAVADRGNPAAEKAEEERQAQQDQAMAAFRKNIMDKVMPGFISGIATSINNAVLSYSKTLVDEQKNAGLIPNQEETMLMLYEVMLASSEAIKENGNADIINEMQNSQRGGNAMDIWFSGIERRMQEAEAQKEQTTTETVQTQVSEIAEPEQGVAPAAPTSGIETGEASGIVTGP